MLFILIAFSFFMGIIYSLNVSIVSDVTTGKNQGKIFGLNNISMVVSESAALSLLGITINRNGYRSAFILVMSGFVLALVFYISYLINDRRNKIA